jgi:hypothetical protein
MMEVETKYQNEKIDPEEFSKTPDGTTATFSRSQKVKVTDLSSRQKNESNFL